MLHPGEAKVFAAEEEEGVEQDQGGVRPQLFAVPQEVLLHTGLHQSCGGEQEGESGEEF